MSPSPSGEIEAPIGAQALGAARHVETLDELELELRRIPGVVAAGFVADDDLVLIRLDAAAPAAGAGTTAPAEILRVAARHTDRPIAIEIARRLPERPSTPAGAATEVSAEQDEDVPVEDDGAQATTGAARVRLLSVLAFPDTDDIEVHLVHDDRRTIGRGNMTGGRDSVVEATLLAAEELVPELAVQNLWAQEIATSDDVGTIVTVSLIVDGGDDGRVRCYGTAGGGGPLEATARATLAALNRQIGRHI